jgi:hypothetical protein
MQAKAAGLSSEGGREGVVRSRSGGELLDAPGFLIASASVGRGQRLPEPLKGADDVRSRCRTRRSGSSPTPPHVFIVGAREGCPRQSDRAGDGAHQGRHDPEHLHAGDRRVSAARGRGGRRGIDHDCSELFTSRGSIRRKSLKKWLAALDDFRNWLTWACGPRNAMKISASE